jgi:hypothetical protein
MGLATYRKRRRFDVRFEVLSIEGPKKDVRLVRAAVRQG